jgi:hypothetical protein
VTPTAVQIFEPHATSAMGDGTYLSLTTRTTPDVTVASNGTDDWKFVIPPTTHRLRDVQANVEIEPCSDATLVHDVPKLFVRTIRQPVKSFANPTHLRPAHVSDVSAPHVSVDGLVSVIHGVSPFKDAATTIPLDAFRKLAMQ